MMITLDRDIRNSMEYDDLSNNGNLSDALTYFKVQTIRVRGLCSYNWLYLFVCLVIIKSFIAVHTVFNAM